jgi:hypothetical protein
MAGEKVMEALQSVGQAAFLIVNGDSDADAHVLWFVFGCLGSLVPRCPKGKRFASLMNRS